MWRSRALYSSRETCRQIEGQLKNMAAGKATNPGRYTTLRRVAKSAALSENEIRGQPLGDSAAARVV